MQIPGFCGPAYKSASLAANAQRCVNLYLEPDPTGRSPYVLYGTPGLRTLVTVGDGPIRAQVNAKENLLVVSGNGLYRIQPDLTVTQLLTLVTSEGFVSIAEAGEQALIVDGTAGYGVDLATWTAQQIADADFPTEPKTCCAIDGYFITHSEGTQQFFVSEPFNVFSWNALQFASKEGSNDPILAVTADYRELYLIGSQTTEIWATVSSAEFPFERIQGAFIEHGAVAFASIGRMDSGVFFLGRDDVGQGRVLRMQGFQPQVISTPALQAELQTYATLEDAIGYCYQQGGHSFYVLSFPTARKTWCFDSLTETWHERMYRNPALGRNEHHRSTCHALFNGLNVVGDRLSGKLFVLDPETIDDDGDPLISIRSSPHVYGGGKVGFCGTFELLMESGVGTASGQGSAPTATLRISRNGGRTFGVARQRTLGRAGEYEARARWNRNGRGRDFVFEVSISDPVKRVITGATVEIQWGNG